MDARTKVPRRWSLPWWALESGISRTVLYESIAAGRLVAKKVGRRTLVTPDEFARFLDGLPRAGAKDLSAEGV